MITYFTHFQLGSVVRDFPKSFFIGFDPPSSTFKFHSLCLHPLSLTWSPQVLAPTPPPTSYRIPRLQVWNATLPPLRPRMNNWRQRWSKSREHTSNKWTSTIDFHASIQSLAREGCAMCWLVTLFEPVANQVAKYDHHQLLLTESTSSPKEIPSMKE